MSPGDEETLLQRARGGDAAAYAELRDAHLGPARELARLIASGDDVELVVEAAFTRIGDQLASGGGPTEKFGAYVSAMVRDRHRDLLRTRRLEQQEAATLGVRPSRPARTTAPEAGVPALPEVVAAAGAEVVHPPESSPFWEWVRDRVVVPAWLLEAWDRLRALPPRPTAAVVAFVLVASAVTTWVVLVSEDPDPPTAEIAVDPEPGGVGAEHRERGGVPESPDTSPPATPSDDEEDDGEGEGASTGPFDLLDPDSPLVDPTTGLPTLPLPGTADPSDSDDAPGRGPRGPRPPGTPGSGGADPTAPGPTAVRPVAPRASTISSCGSYGSLTMPRTTGVRYAVVSGDGRQGPWRVRASATSGYVLAAGAPTSFSGDLGEHYACPSLASVGKSKAGGRTYNVTASVSAPGPGPRTLEVRFVFGNRTKVHGSSGAGWSCDSARTLNGGAAFSCTTVVDGGSPGPVTVVAERIRLLNTEPSGSATLLEDGTQRGSSGF